MKKSVVPFIERYPELTQPPLHLLKNKEILNRLVERAQKLTHAIGRYAKFRTRGNLAGVYGTTPTRKTFEKRPFKQIVTDDTFQCHFLGKYAVAIHVLEYNQSKETGQSNWFFFDVDIKDPLLSEQVAIKIHDILLTYGIRTHISTSGKKGFHVEAYLQKPVPLVALENFADYIFDKYQLHKIYSGEVKPKIKQIEFRPWGGWAAKLPCGVHGKTGNFCSHLVIENGLLKPVESPYEYYISIPHDVPDEPILAIHHEVEREQELEREKLRAEIEQKKMERELLKQREKQSKKDKKKSDSSSEKKDGIEHAQSAAPDHEIDFWGVVEYVLQGHLFPGVPRHFTLLRLAAFLKGRGYFGDALREKLYVWSERLYRNQGDEFDASLIEHYAEVDRVVENANPMKLKTTEVRISKEKFRKFLWMIKIPDRSLQLPLVKVFIALQCYAAIKQSKNVLEPFEVATTYLTKMLEMSPKTVIKSRNTLVSLGLLEVLRKPERLDLVRKIDPAPGLFRLTLDITSYNDEEETIIIGSETFHDPLMVEKLLLLVCSTKKDLVEVLGGRRFWKKANRIWSLSNISLTA